MITMIIIHLVGMALAAILYRAGGMSKEESSFIPTWLRHSWCRDWLIPAVVFGVLVGGRYLSTEHGLLMGLKALIIFYGLQGFALSTYWKFGAKDAKWYNWALHGLGCGLAALPFIFCGISWYAVGLRAIALAWLMTRVSETSDDVFVEEYHRGFLNILTLPILYL
jgi:hypothetical protein